MRTLGSLTTLPETPVVRNARQPFVYDDRYRRSEPCDRQAFLRCNSFNSKNAFRARNAPSRFHPQIGSKASAANAELKKRTALTAERDTPRERQRMLNYRQQPEPGKKGLGVRD
jgi:hypothetical protein